MALQFQFAIGATSFKPGLQSCNSRMQRSVALRSRPWTFQVRAAGDGDVRVNEVARVEREPLPFQRCAHLRASFNSQSFGEISEALFEFRRDVLELAEAAEEADVWEDTEENRLRKRAAWRAAKAAKAAREIEEKLKLVSIIFNCIIREILHQFRATLVFAIQHYTTVVFRDYLACHFINSDSLVHIRLLGRKSTLKVR